MICFFFWFVCFNGVIFFLLYLFCGFLLFILVFNFFIIYFLWDIILYTVLANILFWLQKWVFKVHDKSLLVVWSSRQTDRKFCIHKGQRVWTGLASNKIISKVGFHFQSIVATTILRFYGCPTPGRIELV